MIFKGKYKNILFIFLIFFILTYFIRIYQEYKFSFFLKNLSPEYVIGQHLMVAPEGTNLTSQFKNLIKKYNIGNIKIYGYNYENVEQLHDLIIECQNLAIVYNKNVPLFVATDQEGGWIAHLRKGFTIPPSAYAIGRKKNRHYAYLSGEIIAKELAVVGINMNFGPVADLYLNEKNWVIGPRSYSASPEIAVEMMSEYIKAHLDNNIIPIIKHYPGLGRIKRDPHVYVITNTADYNTLIKKDLKPFNELMKTYENGVMIGNVAVPSIVKHMEKVDKKDYSKDYTLPVVMSEVVLKKYLIKYKKFRGLIVSDEMNVPPIKNLMSMEKAAYYSLKAGTDIFLINQSPDKIVKIMNYLKKKYETDEDFRIQLKNSLKKILRYKASIFMKKNILSYLSNHYFSIKKFNKNKELDKINNKELKNINYKISLNTIDINRNRKKWIPLNKKYDLSKKKIIIVSSKRVLFKEMKKYINYRNLKYIKINSYITTKINKQDIDNIVYNIDRDSIIIISVLSKAHERIVKAIYKKNKNIIVINLLHPYNIKELNMINTILSTYSDNDTQISAGIEVLIKGEEARFDIKDERAIF